MSTENAFGCTNAFTNSPVKTSSDVDASEPKITKM